MSSQSSQSPRSSQTPRPSTRGRGRARVLVIDDQPRTAELLARVAPELEILMVRSRAGGEARPHARSWREAAPLLEGRRPPDVVVLDLRFDLPDEELLPDERPLGESAAARRLRRERRDRQGLFILERLRRRRPEVAVLLTTAYEEIPFEQEALELKADAFTYAAAEEESGSGHLLVSRLRRILEERAAPQRTGRFFWGASAAMRELRRKVSALAPTPMPLLVTGPTGTGKSLLVRDVIHPLSGRAGAFVPFDCATVPEGLLQAALFGALRGSFTGAVADRPGVFEAASDGTLFLDEIENLAPDAQKMLLTALNDGTIRRLGSAAETPHTARVVAASNAALARRAAEGSFRSDLWMRLNPSLALELPPLSERREDLPELARLTAAAFWENPRHRRAIASLVRAAGGPDPEPAGAFALARVGAGGARVRRPGRLRAARKGVGGDAAASVAREPPPVRDDPGRLARGRRLRRPRRLAGARRIGADRARPAPALRPAHRGARLRAGGGDRGLRRPLHGPPARFDRRGLSPRARAIHAARALPGGGRRLRAHGGAHDGLGVSEGGARGAAALQQARPLRPRREVRRDRRDVILEAILGAVFFGGVLAQETAATPGAPAPVSGDCAADPATLAAEARALLGAVDAGAVPDAGTLRRARDLLRRARKGSSGAGLDLAAADLAFAAGDEEEGADLLAAAAERDPARLSPPELLLLARRAQARRRWREAIARYQDLGRALERGGEGADWIPGRVRELELEARADAIAPPAAGPPVEARLALADARRALASGRLQEARDRLRAALDLAPDYTEALLALGAVETRARRPAAAIRAYRGALAAEPDRIEALTALANLLWEEPDRRTKEESLRLLDRAASLRPDLRSLLRLSATRWAEFGDAPKALERLDRFLERASPQERADAAVLRDALSRRVRGAAEEPTPGVAPQEETASSLAVPEGPAAAAVDRWRKAQVYLERGVNEAGGDADAEALRLLAESERLDPAFAGAPELAASIYLREERWREAEDALRRAVRLDPSRVANHEQLARLLDRRPGRDAEALDAWRKAEAAGSTEALIRLARAAESAGSSREALRLYRRYGSEAPAGPGAEEAAASAARLEGDQREKIVAAGSVVALALAAALWLLGRRRFGLTFAEWLARDPAKAHEARPVVGRLRHEVLKHGGMLLSDAAARLEEGDAETRRATAQLLSARLYGESGARGLLAEADAALAQLHALARASGVRLNLRHRDPVFAWLLRGLEVLRRARRSLRRVAERPTRLWDAALARRLLRRAAACFAVSSGPELARTVDRAGVLPVRADALRALLAGVAEERGAPAPELELVGGLVEGGLPGVRISALDWETVWRNLFANALEEARRRGAESLRLGLCAEKRRDPVTGESRVRVVLADDLAGGIDSASLRERAAERGLGVVVELLRKSEGSVEVVPAPGSGFTKGIAIDLPAAEETA